MRTASPLLLALVLAPVLGLALPAGAQTPAPAAGSPPAGNLERDPTPSDRHNQKIEKITHEDAGSRVDEVRVGGQTQSITVQPKAGDMPAYEVQSTDGIRAKPVGRDDGNNGGSRVWNVLKF